MNIDLLWSVGISVATTIVTFIVKDKIFKASVESKFKSIDYVDTNQEKAIEQLRNEQIQMKQSVVLLQQEVSTMGVNLKELKLEVREENEKTSAALNENTKAINKLQGTLEGLTQILNRRKR